MGNSPGELKKLLDIVIRKLTMLFTPHALFNPKLRVKPKNSPLNIEVDARTYRIGRMALIWSCMFEVTPSKNPNSAGYTIRDGHCHGNPNQKKNKVIQDYLHPDEIHLITELYGSVAKPRPHQGKLKDFPNADLYYDAIAVWTQYWNEIFKPEVFLDPDMLKARIASESSFEPIPKEQNAGRA